jgi:hypothetical protein
MGIIKIYHDKKWTLQFLDALYNSIDVNFVNRIKMPETAETNNWSTIIMKLQ